MLVAIFGMLFCAQYSAERVKWWTYVISVILYKLCIYYNALGFFNWEKQVEKSQFSDLPKDQGLNPIPKWLLYVNWFGSI